MAKELIIGIVELLGAGDVRSHVEHALTSLGYVVQPVKMIEAAREFTKWADGGSESAKELRCTSRMDIGDAFRNDLKRADALALGAMAKIRKIREDSMGGPADARRAYVLHTLKTPQEVESLRDVYGSNFVLIGVYEPRGRRVDKLAAEICASRHDTAALRYRDDAERLINRDESGDGEELGQNTRDTFPLADFFVDAGDPTEAKKQVRRFVELLFGNPRLTPSRAEVSMFHAYGAALRSSAPRQVGAAIVTDDGDVIATGTNEDAKAFGGQYWSDDADDDPRSRVGARGLRSSDEMNHGVLVDLLARLAKKGWLVEEKAKVAAELSTPGTADLLKPLPRNLVGPDDHKSLLEKARLDQLIDYMTPVHGEMSALMSAARRGVAVDGRTLYCTTFPCHQCARHIVMAGIKRVVFIEPYPKSRVAWLYEDSIAVDERSSTGRVPFHAFAGVAPRMYERVFGSSKTLRSSEALNCWGAPGTPSIEPRVGFEVSAYNQVEGDCVLEYIAECKDRGLVHPAEASSEPAVGA